MRKINMLIHGFLICVLPLGIFAATGVQFSVTYTDSASEGFFDPTYGTGRQSSFEYACSIWSSYLGASYVGETINISASFNGMGGTATSATLGSAGPERINGLSGPTGTHWYNAANANHLLTSDIESGYVEITAQFNSDVDNGTVLGATDFYYGLDETPGSHIDFTSVVLHEIGHGLGFTPLINSTSGAYLYSDIPSIYDAFLGQDNGDSSFTYLTDMTDAERLDAITSDELFWLGANAIAANGDEAVKIYSPTNWQQGSSISHEDEGTYPLALMSPSYSGALHTPDDLTLGMLEDMGWDIIPEPSSLMMISFISAIAFWIRRRFCE